MKNIQLLLTIPLFFFACESDNNTNCVVVSGSPITETRQVDDFHSVSLEGVGNILLTQGTPQLLQIESHPVVLNLLETTVSNGELKIKLRDCIEGQINKLDIYVTIPEIEKLEIAGVGNIVGQNAISVESLEIEIMGVGDVSLFGTTDQLEINSAGVGNVRAFDLISSICAVNLSGTGNVEVTAEVELEANISGAGNISYKGTPVIDANISGSGILINAN